MAGAPSKGELYECRVARLLHHEGAFVRRAVDLQLHFGEPFTVTDVDVLALTFLPSLRRQVTVGECKTTEARNAPSAADRLLWGSGVRRLVPGADRHFVAVVRPASDKVRALARQLGAGVMDERDLSRREQLLGLDPDDLSGPHDPAHLEREKQVYAVVKRDDELKRVWGFVRADFWFSDAVYGLKRALGALRLLARRWHPELPAAEAETVRWLVEEGTAAVVISLTELAGECYRQPHDVFERNITKRLSEGQVPFDVMQQVSKDVDRYLLAVLEEEGIDPAKAVGRLGALDPSPPPYTEPLLEVLERLAETPRYSVDLGRMLDERISSRRGSPVPTDASRIPQAEHASLRLETVATFLKAQVRLPDELIVSLMERHNQARPSNDSSGTDSVPADTNQDGGSSEPASAERLFPNHDQQ